MSEPFTDTNRRSFIKKSLAGVFIASQPAVLTGLLRANGEGGGTGVTKLSADTTGFYLIFTMPQVTGLFDTTFVGTWPTTVPGTTVANWTTIV
jgi:hypothetical protein